MVRRLVEKQQVGLACEGASERRAAQLAAGEAAHPARRIHLKPVEPGRDLVCCRSVAVLRPRRESLPGFVGSSAERREGKECVRTGRSRVEPETIKEQKK